MNLRFATLAALAVVLAASVAHAAPDLSGYWSPPRGPVREDPALTAMIAPGTVILQDTGVDEYPPGEYGGLKLKPETLAAAKAWKPSDDMTLSRVCAPPSIVYGMQGPFPFEIHQGTEFIIFKLEYYDLVRIVFMDGRKPSADIPLSKSGFSTGRWEGDVLVVETTRLEPSTITNNGLGHSDEIRVTERLKLSADGKTLFHTQEFEDPKALENRGARLMHWTLAPGQHVFPYECDPSYALNYKAEGAAAPEQ